MRLVLVTDLTEGDVVETTLEQFVAAYFPDADDLLADQARDELADMRRTLAAGGVAHGVDLQGRDWLLGTPYAVTERLSRQSAG